MTQPLNLISTAFQQYFRNDIVLQYLKQAQTPFQSSELFPVKRILANNPNQAESRKKYLYRVTKGRPLAGELNEGSTEYKDVSYGTYEEREVNIIQLGDKIKYTLADEERVRQMMAIASALTLQTATLSILNEYLPTNPTQMMTAMDNSKEIINFFGNAGLSQLLKTDKLQITNNGTVFGLLNSPDIDNVSINANSAGDILWSKKSGSEIYVDILNAYNYIYKQKSGFTIQPTTLLVDPIAKQVLDNTFFNEYKGVTVSDQIRDALKIEIIACPWISTPIGSTDIQRFFIYTKNPSYIELIDSANPYIMNLPNRMYDNVEYSMRSYTAGLAVYQPNSIASFKGFV